MKSLFWNTQSNSWKSFLFTIFFVVMCIWQRQQKSIKYIVEISVSFAVKPLLSCSKFYQKTGSQYSSPTMSVSFVPVTARNGQARTFQTPQAWKCYMNSVERHQTLKRNEWNVIVDFMTMCMKLMNKFYRYDRIQVCMLKYRKQWNWSVSCWLTYLQTVCLV